MQKRICQAWLPRDWGSVWRLSFKVGTADTWLVGEEAGGGGRRGEGVA